MKTLKNAVLYARVSTDEQAERDNSIPAQIKAIKAFAKSNGIQVLHEYIDEGRSAKTADRPQFQQMISDAKRKDKEFNIILVHKTDRFARNRNDSVIYKSLLKSECEVDVISVTENFDDSPTGKLLEGMMEVIAEFHSLNLAQEVMKGLRQKAEQGVYVGRTPFGYDLDEETKKLVVNEKEAEVIRMIFELYAQGNSFATIKQMLNQAGILTRADAMWDSSAIKRTVKNPVYTGQYTWNRVKRANNSVKDESDWVVVENAHEPIITPELFESARRVLQSKSSMQGPATKSPYLLSSMIKCGHCGHNLIGEKKINKGKTYYRYVCSHHLNHKMCFYNFVHKDEIENLVIEGMRTVLQTGVVDEDQVVIVESKSNESEKDLLEARLQKVKQKFQRQFEAYEAEVISLQELQEAKKRVLEEEKEINEQMAALKKKNVQKALGKRLQLHFNGLDEVLATNDQKVIKLWLKERIYKIEVFHKEDISIQYKLPW